MKHIENIVSINQTNSLASCGDPQRTMPANGKKEYQKTFAEKVITNQKLDCTSPLETVYFSKKLGPVKCFRCGLELSAEPERMKMYESEKSKFSVVLPTCELCGEFKKQFPKKKTGKPEAASASKKPKPSKKQKTTGKRSDITSFFKPKAKRPRK